MRLRGRHLASTSSIYQKLSGVESGQWWRVDVAAVLGGGTGRTVDLRTRTACELTKSLGETQSTAGVIELYHGDP